jgi:quercetin dioxygenase-like cupin family protein
MMILTYYNSSHLTAITLSLILLTSVFYLAGCSERSKEDPNTDSSELADERIKGIETEIFQNKYAKVLKVEISPGQQLPWHKGGPRLLYPLSDYTIRLKKNPDDTTSRENSFQEGDVHWHDQNRHSVENIGDSAAEFLVFMRKPTAFPKITGVDTESDVAEAVPSDTNVLLENDVVKITKVALNPRANAPMHAGTKRVIYSLNDYAVRFNAPNEPAKEETFSKGDVHWHKKGKHSIENTGEDKARFLVIEFKK